MIQCCLIVVCPTVCLYEDLWTTFSFNIMKVKTVLYKNAVQTADTSASCSEHFSLVTSPLKKVTPTFKITAFGNNSVLFLCKANIQILSLELFYGWTVALMDASQFNWALYMGKTQYAKRKNRTTSQYSNQIVSLIRLSTEWPTIFWCLPQIIIQSDHWKFQIFNRFIDIDWSRIFENHFQH